MKKTKTKGAAPAPSTALEKSFVRVLSRKGARGRASIVTPFSLEPTERIQLEARASVTGFSKTALIRFALAVCERGGWAAVPQVHVALKAKGLLKPNGTLVDDIVDRDYRELRITPEGKEIMLEASRGRLDSEPI